MFRQQALLDNAKKQESNTYTSGACGPDDTTIGHWHQFVERYIEWSGFLLPRTLKFYAESTKLWWQKSNSRWGTSSLCFGARLSWVDG
jgi:hypothetical protein